MRGRETKDVSGPINRNAKTIKPIKFSFDVKLEISSTIFEGVELDNRPAVQYSFDISCGDTGWSCRVKVFSDRFNSDGDKIRMCEEMMEYAKVNLPDRVLRSMQLLIDEALVLSPKLAVAIDRTDARDQHMAILEEEKTKAFGVRAGRRAGSKTKSQKKRATKITLQQIENKVRYYLSQGFSPENIKPSVIAQSFKVSARTVKRRVEEQGMKWGKYLSALQAGHGN